jgi:NNP family nitrate/nitrite transporter-like MFS transporter
MGFVRDVTGAYAIGFMLLSEFALLCLLVNVLVLQQRARELMPREQPVEVARARRVA